MNPSDMSVEDILALEPDKQQEALCTIKKWISNLEDEEIVRKATNPFKYFIPSDGNIPPQNLEFLMRHLKEEDIPQSFDSQLDALICPDDIIGVMGGNQGGKTAWLAIRLYIQATGQLPDALYGKFPTDLLPKKFPQRLRVVGVDSRQLQNAVLREFRLWCPRQFLKNGKWESSYAAEKKILTLYRNDNRELASLEFMTNQQDVDSFQGIQLTGVGYDEEPMEKIRKENLMRFVTSDRVFELYAFTPTHGLSWSTELFFKDEGDAKLYKIASVTNKKANLKTLEKLIEQETDYNKKRMRLLGDYVSLSGLVYANLFSEKIHVRKPFELNKEDFIVYRGLDPHMTKPTVAVEIAVDREGFKYVVGTYKSNHGDDTEIIKEQLAKRALERNYRLGWTNCDKSADSTIRIIGDYNAYVLLGRGRNAIPALFKSEKFVGSIAAGVDLIRQNLKVDDKINLPKLVIFDIPENRELIHSMKTLERDTFANEDTKVKDEIKEGKHDAHAAMRYAHQRVMNWMPFNQIIPEPEEVDENIGY